MFDRIPVANRAVQSFTRQCLVLLAISTAGFVSLGAQPAPTAAAGPGKPIYLIPVLPSHVIGLLSVYGNRLTKPGNERLTLTGTFVDAAGSSTATIITEIPDKIRVVLTGAETKTLLFDGSQSSNSGAALTAPDQDVLESLQSDAPESFFYAFHRGAVRNLGARYRIDGGKTSSYNGPYYDIYQVLEPTVIRSGSPVTQKLYYFDSITGVFAKTHYLIQNGGQPVAVETVYSNWSKSGGQSTPGRIERLENGTSMFSLTVTSSVLSQAGDDSIFSTP